MEGWKAHGCKLKSELNLREVCEHSEKAVCHLVMVQKRNL